MSVVTSSTFDVKKLTTSEIKKLDNGSSQVYLNYAGGKMRLQGPRLPIPYDTNDYQGNGKFKAQVSFRDRHTNPKVAAYLSTLEAIDNFVIDMATKNAAKWFKLPGASRETISLFYTPSIKIAKDKDGNPKDYPPSQSISLKKKNDGEFDVILYDKTRQEIEGVPALEILRRNAEITPVIDATGIWVADKKFGLTWKLIQAIVNVRGEGARSGCLIEEESDTLVSATEESNLMSAVLPSAGAGSSATASATAPVATPVATSAEVEEENEDDEEDEDEVLPAPPVPAKKATAPVTASATTAVKKVVKKVATKA